MLATWCCLAALLCVGAARASDSCMFDVVWMIDESKSINENGPSAYQGVLQFIANTTSKLAASPSSLRSAFVEFSGEVYGVPTTSHIGNFSRLTDPIASNPTLFNAHMKQLVATFGNTNTKAGFRFVNDTILVDKRPQAQVIVILVTDGGEFGCFLHS